MAEGPKEIYWAVSHTGYKRSRNEDRYLARTLDSGQGVLLAVADGMGGEAGGNIAAQIVIDLLEQEVKTSGTEEDLCQVLNMADREITRRVKADPSLEGMGTTATAVLICERKAYWCHVGDSRLYLYRGGSLRQLTTDHTFVQELLDEGSLTPEQAKKHPMRNLLDQCLGCAWVNPESGRFRLKKADRLLLCSDGLTGHVSVKEMERFLEGEEDPRKAAEQLLQAALDGGGLDNITVAVWFNKELP